MRAGVRKVLLLIGSALLLLGVGEVVLYNWRVSLSLEMEGYREEQDRLARSRQDYDAEIARLSCPGRLEAVGRQLGLGPMPVSSFSLVRLPSDLHRVEVGRE